MPWVPHDLSIALERIETVAPKLPNDPAFRRLSAGGPTMNACPPVQWARLSTGFRLLTQADDHIYSQFAAYVAMDGVLCRGSSY